MEQLLIHLWGDYCTQSDWMANEKTKRWIPAFIHATIYSIPFLLIGSVHAMMVILLTHAIIDRYRLVRFLLKLKEARFNEYWGYITEGDNAKPAFMWVWLMIVADNTMHLTINYFALKYL